MRTLVVFLYNIASIRMLATLLPLYRLFNVLIKKDVVFTTSPRYYLVSIARKSAYLLVINYNKIFTFLTNTSLSYTAIIRKVAINKKIIRRIKLLFKLFNILYFLLINYKKYLYTLIITKKK